MPSYLRRCWWSLNDRIYRKHPACYKIKISYIYYKQSKILLMIIENLWEFLHFYISCFYIIDFFGCVISYMNFAYCMTMRQRIIECNFSILLQQMSCIYYIQCMCGKNVERNWNSNKRDIAASSKSNVRLNCNCYIDRRF